MSPSSLAKVVPIRKRQRESSSPPEVMPNISDAALVKSSQEGDRWAEDVLVRRYAHEVARLVARLLGSHDDVDDIVQDTFLAAFEQIGRLNKPEAFRGWVLSIAVNLTRLTIRKKRFLRTFGLDSSNDDAKLEALALEGVGADVRAELAVLDEVLNRLPSKQRIAWMLRYVEGHTVRDVARLCGCSPATTKRWLSRAQKRVQSVVDPEVLDYVG